MLATQKKWQLQRLPIVCEQVGYICVYYYFPFVSSSNSRSRCTYRMYIHPKALILSGCMAGAVTCLPQEIKSLSSMKCQLQRCLLKPWTCCWYVWWWCCNVCILNDHDTKMKSYLHVCICSNRLNLSPSPFAAMANLFSTLASFCPGSAPVRCHRETGTPFWGSAEVHIFQTVLLFFVFVACSVCLAGFVSIGPACPLCAPSQT